MKCEIGDPSEVLNYYFPNIDDPYLQKTCLEKMLSGLVDCRTDSNLTPEGDKFAEELREWVAGLADAASAHEEGDAPEHEYPLFAGLAAIEHNWTFLKFFIVLLDYLWL